VRCSADLPPTRETVWFPCGKAPARRIPGTGHGDSSRRGREFSEGAGSDHHPLFADLPPIPADVLFRKIANSSAVAFRKLTEARMLEILRTAPQDYAAMR
jgi:hypothetical protein